MYEQESRGRGKALCHVCGEPCRDHDRIGPCPKSGIVSFHGAFAAQPTDRTLWRNGVAPKPARRAAIVQARINMKRLP